MGIFLNTELIRGESNSPRFDNFCVLQFLTFSLFRPHYFFFALHIYFLVVPCLARWDGKKQKDNTKDQEPTYL